MYFDNYCSILESSKGTDAEKVKNYSRTCTQYTLSSDIQIMQHRLIGNSRLVQNTKWNISKDCGDSHHISSSLLL